VTDSAVKTIAGIKTLNSLILSDTMITDTGLLQLGGARRLTYLDVSGTHVSDDGMRELRKSLKDLELDYDWPPSRVQL
jgi:internalin A